MTGRGEPGATGSDLSVDQLAELIGKMNQEDRTQLLGKLQGAIPKTEQKPIHQIEIRGAEGRRTHDDSKLPKLPKFSGSGGKNEPSFRVWRFEVENIRETFSDNDVSRVIHQSVTGNAAEAVMRLGKEATVTQILDKFENLFGTVVSEEKLLADFYTSQQKPSESIADWSCRLEDLVSHPKLKLSPENHEKMLKSRFFYGLHSDVIKNAIRHKFETGKYEEILVLAREAEEEGKLGKAVAKPQTVDPLASQLKDIQEQLKQIKDKMADYDKKIGRTQSYNSNGNEQSKSKETPRKQVSCYYCRKTGHIKKNCPKLASKDKSPAAGSSR